MKKAFLLACVTLSASAVAEPPQQIDIQALPRASTMVDEVVVPVPTEIFGVLDKLERPAWQAVLRPLGKKPASAPGAREQTALLLGTIIAEGFIAVEAQDAEEVKNIGRSVLSLSEALSVKKVVVPRSNAIIQGADKHAWADVRRELDKAQKEVQEAMRELNDEPLSQMVSLGGWLRGTEALSTAVLQKYSVDGAELLHQPILVDYFSRKIDGSKKLSGKPLVEKMREGLKEIKPLMGMEGAPISQKSVEEMKSVTERLTSLIHAKS